MANEIRYKKEAIDIRDHARTLRSNIDPNGQKIFMYDHGVSTVNPVASIFINPYTNFLRVQDLTDNFGVDLTPHTETEPHGALPIGGILVWPFSGNIPSGYKPCTGGASCPRFDMSNAATSKYKQITKLLSRQYTPSGEDDSSTVFMPDFSGLFLRGWEKGGTTAIDKGPIRHLLGEYQEDDYSSHSHNVVLRGDERYDIIGNDYNVNYLAQGGNSLETFIDGGGLETRPNNISVLYIMKVQELDIGEKYTSEEALFSSYEDPFTYVY